MKKYLLTWALITITATTLYATTAGSTVVDKMKAAAHSFTLSTSLNPTDTGLTSDPVKGKKTGDMLTAGEWNRVLELVSEGWNGGTGVMSVKTKTPIVATDTCSSVCLSESKSCVVGFLHDLSFSSSSVDALRRVLDCTSSVPSGISGNSGYALACLCSSGGGGSASIPSNLVYINPENTDFTPIDCTPGVNYMITPIAFNAANASTYTEKKLAVLKTGNWRARGTGFIRNRNTNPDSTHTFRFNSVLDGATTKLFENSVDTGIYASAFSENITVPTAKTVEINVSVRNNSVYGGTVTLWCTN